MTKKNLKWTLFLLMIVLLSGRIQQKVSSFEKDPNSNLSAETEMRDNIFHNKTFLFELKIPPGWKSDKTWQSPYYSVVNFVNDRYPWYPWGDDGVIRRDLNEYGTLSIVQVNMDKQIVPMGYTLEYARLDQMNIKEGIIY